jgi:lipoprotein-releasing system permease protein
MNGFQEELRNRTLGVASHIEVEANGGPVQAWQQVVDEVRLHPEVEGAAPYVSDQGLLVSGKTVRGAQVRGILPGMENEVANFAQHMKGMGSLDELQPGRFGIILGIDLAHSLGVRRPGDKLTLITPQGMVTPAAVMPRVRQFEVVGIFDAGVAQYDGGLVLIHLADAQALYQMGDGVSGVRLRVRDLFAAHQVAIDLSRKMSDLRFHDWTRMHANFFRAVALEKTMMMLFLFLIVCVAAFNVVASLTMTVQEKAADIAILRTLGASPASIMAIFVIQGTIIGVVGLMAGLAGGLGVALNLDVVIPALERLTGATLWDKHIYYISELPSKVLMSDIVTILGVSFVLTLIAAIYPSWRASRVKPAEALRYE